MPHPAVSESGRHEMNSSFLRRRSCAANNLSSLKETDYPSDLAAQLKGPVPLKEVRPASVNRRRVLTFSTRFFIFHAVLLTIFALVTIVFNLLDLSSISNPASKRVFSFLTTHTISTDGAGRAVTVIPGLRGPRADASTSSNGRRRAAVRDATRHSFEGYVAHAWGYDELLPVSGAGVDNFFGPSGFRGLTVLDSIDTLAVMGLDDLLVKATEWVREFGRDGFAGVKEVGVFESVIRLLGGLIGAWEVTHEDLFLERAEQIGNLLVRCFLDASQPPLSRLNVEKGKCGAYDHGSTVPAEINLILEWWAMARARGGFFKDAVNAQREVIKTLQDNFSFGGLIPSDLSQKPFAAGSISRCRDAGVGAPSDSYYEYFIKSHIMTRGAVPELWEYWWQVVDTVLDVLLVDVPGFGLVLTNTEQRYVDLPRRKTVTSVNIQMDHFSCFIPGLLYMSAGLDPPSSRGPLSPERRDKLLRAASGLTKSCVNLYNTTTGLSGENVRFNSDGSYIFQGEYNLRPEVVEALFYESRLAPDPAVRARAQDMAWKIFQAMEEHSKTPFGYATIRNPNGDLGAMEKQDNMPSFLIAETFKYLYLTFQDEGDKGTHVMDLKEWVLTTEAHPVRIERP